MVADIAREGAREVIVALKTARIYSLAFRDIGSELVVIGVSCTIPDRGHATIAGEQP